MDGAHPDLFARLGAGASERSMAAANRKRKWDSATESMAIPAKVARMGSRKAEKQQMMMMPVVGGDDGAGALLPEDAYEEEDPRSLPMLISTIDVGVQDIEGTEPWNVFTKGFFYVKGSDLRAGYWVYYKGHCVSKAYIWNNEYDEIRYDHQGYAPCMRGLNKSNVTLVSIGLLAIMDAIAWAKSTLSFASWHIYSDNLEALKLVDMYQRNLQFLKFHAERPLLDSIIDAAQSSCIHLHRR